MANISKQEPIIGSDDGIWGDPELSQNRPNLSAISTLLYDDAGTLKISKGMIGFDDGTNKGICVIDTITSISLAGVSNGNWAKIEMEITAGLPVFSASDIAGATLAATIPSGFTGAWDYDKQGYYISATKRCVGLCWKTAGGVLSGVVNCLPMGQGYIGNSPDATFCSIKGKNLQVIGATESENMGTLHLIPEASRPAAWVLNGGVAAAFTDVDFSGYAPVGTKALLLRAEIFFSGDGTLNYCQFGFRKNGSAEVAEIKVLTAYLGVYDYNNYTVGSNIDFIVECDAGRIIEYIQGLAVGVVGGGTLNLTIDGYYK